MRWKAVCVILRSTIALRHYTDRRPLWMYLSFFSKLEALWESDWEGNNTLFSKGRSNRRCKMFLPLKKVRIRCVWILCRVIVRGKFSSRGVLQTETSDYDIRTRRNKKWRCRSVESTVRSAFMYLLRCELLSPGIPGGLPFVTPGVTAEVCRCFVTQGNELVVDLTGNLLVFTVIFSREEQFGRSIRTLVWGQSWGKTWRCHE